MKKLLLLLVLSTTLLSNAQVEMMEGMWGSETSSFTTTIITYYSTAVKVYNTSFTENRVIEEEIISQDDNSFTTKLVNHENGYSVLIKYVLKDSTTLLCYYSGDLEETITIKKLPCL